MTGFFDLQVNGYAGADFCSLDLTIEDTRRACESMRSDGLGGILATVITDHVDALVAKLERLRSFRDADPFIAEMIRGFHVEGPFLSPRPGFIGAHAPECVVPANPPDADRILEAGGGLVRVMTLAPEHDEGFATTRFLAERGVTVSAGHCDPDYETLAGAIDAGLSMFTHLGNGCPVELPRHDNIIQRALALSDRLWIGVIPDGVHVPFLALRNYIRICGVERLITTTDAIVAAGLPPGTYELSGSPVEVDKDGVARRPGSLNLAGSTIRAHRGAALLSSELGLSPDEVERVFRDNPLRACGLSSAGFTAS